MTDDSSAIIIGGVITVATNAVTWIMSKRRYTAETDNVIADGADKIVDTSNKLLEMIKQNLEEERAHRSACELKVESLEKRLKELERRL